MRSRLRVAAALLGVGLAASLTACASGGSSTATNDADATTTTQPRPTTTTSPALLTAACQGRLVASTPVTVANPAAVELSGIAASRRNPGVWWAHNDSGDSARVFAIGDIGEDLGTYALSSATNVDWEDIAVGPGPAAGTSYLYVGDIGDNERSRGSVVVYRVAEPAIDRATAGPGVRTLTDVAKLVLQYPGGAKYDAEALLVDPVTAQLFVITKDASGTARVFQAPANGVSGSTTVMTDVATLSLGALQMVTGADITPAGDVVGVRTYLAVLLYPRSKDSTVAAALAKSPCDGAAPNDVLSQYEALGFTPDGRGYVTTSEGARPTLRSYRAP